MQTLLHRLQVLMKVIRFFFLPPSRGRMALRHAWHTRKGRGYSESFKQEKEGTYAKQDSDIPNPLLDFFKARTTGPGIWKWTHYFEVYHQYFAPFVGTEVRFLEIGIYSGGSLDMWCQYFGQQAKVYGVDIEPACRSYASKQVEVFIGDQADPQFWQQFTSDVPQLDIVIDDGGHTTQQQIVTLEALLPHLNPSGIYIIEDIHGKDNLFASYLYGLQQTLNTAHFISGSSFKTKANSFQQLIHSIHLYPYLAVIQKRKEPLLEFPSPKQGTQWQPFYE